MDGSDVWMELTFCKILCLDVRQDMKVSWHQCLTLDHRGRPFLFSAKPCTLHNFSRILILLAFLNTL